MNIKYSLPLLENKTLEFQFNDGRRTVMQTENVVEACGEMLLYCRIFDFENNDIFGQSVYVYNIVEYGSTCYCVYSQGTGMGFNILDLYTGESILDDYYHLIVHSGSNIMELVLDGDNSLYFNLSHKMVIDINSDLTNIFLTNIINKNNTISRIYPSSRQVHINSNINGKTKTLTGLDKITYTLFCHTDFEYMEPGEIYPLSSFALTSEIYDTFSSDYTLRQLHNTHCKYYEFESRGYTPSFGIDTYSISNQTIFDQYYIKEEEYKLDVLVSRIYGAVVQYRIDILCDNSVYTISDVSQFVRINSNLYLIVFNNTDMVSTYDGEVVVNRCNLFYFDVVNHRKGFKPLTRLNRLKIISLPEFKSVDLSVTPLDSYIYFKQVKNMIFDMKRSQWLGLIVPGLDVSELDINQLDDSNFVINGMVYTNKYISEEGDMYLRRTTVDNVLVFDRGPYYTIDERFYNILSPIINMGFKILYKSVATFHNSEIVCYFVKNDAKTYLAYTIYGQSFTVPIPMQSVETYSKFNIIFVEKINVDSSGNYISVTPVFIFKHNGQAFINAEESGVQSFKEVSYNSILNCYVVQSMNPPNNYSFLENIKTPISSVPKFTNLELLFDYLKVPLINPIKRTTNQDSETLRIRNEIKHFEKKYNVNITESNGIFTINTKRK